MLKLCRVEIIAFHSINDCHKLKNETRIKTARENFKN